MATKKATTKTTVDVEETVAVGKKSTATASKTKTVEIDTTTLTDTDEIEIEALIPHVSYKDTNTNDMYRWDEVGQVETMTYAVIKNMWRNSKSYFNKLWLKPLDPRVIKKLGLERTYANYEFLLNSDSYTRENIDDIIATLGKIDMGLKFSVSTKIKEFVIAEDITDAVVIRKLENCLNMDLLVLL